MKRVSILMTMVVIAVFGLALLPAHTQAGDAAALTISGYIRNSDGYAVAGAEVTAQIRHEAGSAPIGPGAQTHSDEDGAFLVRMSLAAEQRATLAQPGAVVLVQVSKATFATAQVEVPVSALAADGDRFFAEADVTVQRKATAAVFLSAIILATVYVLISFERVHRTVAALLGAAAVLFITHVLGFFSAEFIILPFERAVTYIDLNVILLLMAMMVLVTITARTGFFQWLAVAAYRLAGGNTWRLVAFFMIATAILSAFLDNVTTMLLVVPVTIEIAVLLRLNALALLLPEVFASNLGGAATLIGDPPNLLIGSYSGLGFEQFVIWMTPAVIVSMIGLVAIVRVMYRGQFPRSSPEETEALLHRLEKEFKITDMATLRQSLIVFGGVIVLFLLSSFLGMEPCVPALVGMSVLLIWTKADVVEELEGVEWPSLLFFIGLFIVVGAASETGVIEALARAVATLAGGHFVLAIILIVWITALASMLIDNIPITATMLPVVAYLTHAIAGAPNILYWALAFGACFGGNGTVVGASANIVTAGLAERAGYSVTFGHFARKGLPVTIMSLVIATAWLLLMNALA